MYTTFYNLNKKPFQISSDPSFMWFGEKHKEALATLRYGILDNKGFLLLTGDVGTGKTTLINALIQSLSQDIIFTSIPDPGLEKLDFFNFIAGSFGIKKEFSTKGKFLAHFQKFLLKANEDGKQVLLIIDEAQRLTQQMLEEIRLLSNIEKMDNKLINIFFVGQNEFNEILNRDQNRAVRQRLTLNYNIDPLTPDETIEYISHRLKIAGSEELIFDMPACQEIFVYSGGFPRRINVICDHCLLSGYVKEQKIITADIVAECAKELKIPAYIRNRDIDGYASYKEEKPPPEIRQQPVAEQTFVPQQQPVVQQTFAPQQQPVVQETFAPPPQPETPPTREGAGTKIISSIVIVIVLVVFAWFLFFPKEFKSATDSLGQRVLTIRQSIAAMVPEPYASFFYKESGPGSSTGVKANDIVSEKIDSQSVTDTPPETQHPNPGKSTKSQQRGLKAVKGSDSPPETSKNDKPIQSKEIVKKTIQGTKKKTKSSSVSTKESLQVKSKIDKAVTDPKPGPTVVLNEKQPLKSDGSKINTEIKLPPLPAEKVIIRFKYNTNDFTEEEYSKLVNFSKVLLMHPDAKLLISGYTDSDGYQKYNRKLSEFRANIVRSFLLGRGIRPEQVLVRGFGSENPIESNDTAWGRKMNRRVEIEVVN